MGNIIEKDMITHWFHSLRGDYNISSTKVRLNFGALMSNPFQAQLTLFHEATHSFLAAQTEFGQATYVFYKAIKFFKHLSEKEIESMTTLFYSSQKFTQEGFATLIQYLRMKSLTDEKEAGRWVQEEVCEEYQGYLNKLSFISDLDVELRDLFTAKVSYLVMETGIRKNAVKLDLFRSPENLNAYLAIPDNNPDERLSKVIDVVKISPALLRQTFPEIAKACNISYFEPSTKDEVADFQNYVAKLIGSSHKYAADEILDAPPGSETFENMYTNMMVVNLDIDLRNNTELLHSVNDFLFYSDSLEVVFVNLQVSGGIDREFIEKMSEEKPEVSLIGFMSSPSKQKYVVYVSKETAEKVLNNELRFITFATKWGAYSPITNKLIWSEKVRLPDLIIYNTPKDLQESLEEIQKNQTEVTFNHLHSVAMEESDLQSLIVRVGVDPPIHAVNHLGNKGISQALSVIRKRSTVMDGSFLRKNKKHINNLLALWMGMFWEVDWVEGMLDDDKEALHFRK